MTNENFVQVYNKSYKRGGVVYEGNATDFFVCVEKNKSIKIKVDIKDRNGNVTQYFTEYKIGDLAEYDAFNLSYLGEIQKITDKTVTIKNMYDKNTRLDMASFCRRNYKGDIDDKIEKNHETMMYI